MSFRFLHIDVPARNDDPPWDTTGMIEKTSAAARDIFSPVLLLRKLQDCSSLVERKMPTVAKIKLALQQCVSGGKCDFLTYGQLNKRFTISNHTRSWANKTVLNKVADEFCKADPPELDLTFLLRNESTKYPSVIDGELSKPPSPKQIVRARIVAQQIIDRYHPGTKNPY